MLGALSDALLAVLPAETAFTILVLGVLDGLQTRYQNGRFRRVENRVGRLENALIQTDGGEPETSQKGE